jgi:hypothetical protein
MLTGAGSYQAAQANVGSSLGGYLSSTRTGGMAISNPSPLSGVSVTYASGGNGDGTGVLTATSTTTLAYTAPGGTQGPAVTIASGNSYLLYDAANPAAYVIVSVTTNSLSNGASSTVVLTTAQDNGISGLDVTSAQTTAGAVLYWGLGLINASSVQASSVICYLGELSASQPTDGGQLPASGAGTLVTSGGTFSAAPQSGMAQIYTSGGTLREVILYYDRNNTTLYVAAGGRGVQGTTAAAGAAGDTVHFVPPIRLGLEVPTFNSGQGVQTIANQTVAPTGVTFNRGITSAAGLSIGNLSAAGWAGVWLEETIPAGSPSNPAALFNLKLVWQGA